MRGVTARAPREQPAPRLAKTANLCQYRRMATLNISLTDEMRAFVDERIASGRYGSASEYFRELLRLDQDRVRQEALERALLEGLSSGDGRKLRKADFDRIREQVRVIAGKKVGGQR